MITITLSAPTPSGNAVLRMHYEKIRRMQKAWAWEIRVTMKKYYPAIIIPPMPRARITITRYSAGTLDDDNLRTGCKPLIDVLQPMGHPSKFGLGIIAGDAPLQVQCEYRQEKCNRAEGWTVLTIEGWEDE